VRKKKVKKTFDSYIYSGHMSIKTTADLLNYLASFDADAPGMKLGEEERDALLEKQMAQMENDRLKRNLLTFKSMYRRYFKKYPFLKHVAESFDPVVIMRERGRGL
jgi:hypothetical protein